MKQQELSEEMILANLSVLYVEDDQETLQELSRYLKRRTGKVMTASNGVEGMKKVKEESVDIIITDLKMPLMDGMEMIKELREEKISVPIIITSAVSDSHRILEAMDLGVIKYVVKPINPKDLLQVLAAVGEKVLKLQQQKLLHENQWTTKEEKAALEQELERSCAAFIKKTTGKGPKRIEAFIQGERVSIEIFDMLTPIEKKLADNPKNITLLSYFRRTLYTEIEEELEKNITGILKRAAKLDAVEQNLRSNRECLQFIIK